MDQNTKQAAADFLAAHKRASEVYDEEGRQLRRARHATIKAARDHGMSWDEIAEHIGWSGGDALRMWYQRAGGDV